MSEESPAGASHLSSEVVAAYLARALSRDERAEVENHLDRCPECRSEVASAAELVHSHRRRRRLATVVPALGVAAAIILIFGLPRPSETPSASAFRGVEEQAEREGVATIEVIGPRDGAVLAPNALVLHWRPIDGRPLYRVTVTDEDGAPVWTSTTEETRARPPESLRLRPGGSYFWYVDAIQEDGRSATTGVRRFTIES